MKISRVSLELLKQNLSLNSRFFNQQVEEIKEFYNNLLEISLYEFAQQNDLLLEKHDIDPAKIIKTYYIQHNYKRMITVYQIDED